MEGPDHKNKMMISVAAALLRGGLKERKLEGRGNSGRPLRRLGSLEKWRLIRFLFPSLPGEAVGFEIGRRNLKNNTNVIIISKNHAF